MKVPLYQEQVGLTPESPGVMGTGGSLDQAGAPGRALQQAGGAVTEIAALVNRQIEHAQNVNDLADFQKFARLQLNDLSNQVQEYDSAARAGAFKQGAEEWFDNYSQNLKNPEVAAVAKSHWATLYPAKLQTVEAEAQKQKILNFAGNLEANFNTSAQLAAQATDDLEAGQIKGEAWSLLEGGVAAGLLHPAKAEQLKQGWEASVIQARANQDVLQNPIQALQKLGKPEENYPGMDAQTALKLRGQAQAEMHRVQNENYTRYMQQILDATADQPAPGAVMPSEEEIQAQISAGNLNAHNAKEIVAYVRGSKDNVGNKTDPQSYKEAVTRLTDPENPLTREEFLKNVESGDWKFGARDFGTFLSNINTRGSKLEKATETAFKAELGYMKTQFGYRPNDRIESFDPKAKYLLEALGQLQQAKDAGELGKTPAEVQQNMRDIYKENLRLHNMEQGMGGRKTETKPGIISRIGSFFGGQGEATPETVTKDGRQYRVMTINGRKMVDPTPLPSQPGGSRAVINKRTGQIEYVTPEQYDLIMKSQGGGK